MALRHIHLDAISEPDLQRLIQDQVAEKRDIDYKANTYGNRDQDYGEFLADVSSFANTGGGEIVIGMTEQAGVPTGLTPLQIDADAETLRLENCVRSGLQPRIFGFAVRAVPITGGGHVFVLRIPRSYNQPHRIVRQGSGNHRFWARSSAGKYEPNVDELRALFTRAPQLADRIRDFRFDRIAKIVGGDTPVPLMGTRPLILHVAPLSAFEGAQSFRLDINQAPQHFFTAFPPIGAQVGDFRINVDGALVLSKSRRRRTDTSRVRTGLSQRNSRGRGLDVRHGRRHAAKPLSPHFTPHRGDDRSHLTSLYAVVAGARRGSSIRTFGQLDWCKGYPLFLRHERQHAV
jgi:hypothetical protein